jgi:hypothetical protein
MELKRWQSYYDGVWDAFDPYVSGNLMNMIHGIRRAFAIRNSVSSGVSLEIFKRGIFTDHPDFIRYTFIFWQGKLVNFYPRCLNTSVEGRNVVSVIKIEESASTLEAFCTFSTSSFKYTCHAIDYTKRKNHYRKDTPIHIGVQLGMMAFRIENKNFEKELIEREETYRKTPNFTSLLITVKSIKKHDNSYSLITCTHKEDELSIFFPFGNDYSPGAVLRVFGFLQCTLTPEETSDVLPLFTPKLPDNWIKVHTSEGVLEVSPHISSLLRSGFKHLCHLAKGGHEVCDCKISPITELKEYGYLYLHQHAIPVLNFLTVREHLKLAVTSKKWKERIFSSSSLKKSAIEYIRKEHFTNDKADDYDLAFLYEMEEWDLGYILCWAARIKYISVGSLICGACKKTMTKEEAEGRWFCHDCEEKKVWRDDDDLIRVWKFREEDLPLIPCLVDQERCWIEADLIRYRKLLSGVDDGAKAARVESRLSEEAREAISSVTDVSSEKSKKSKKKRRVEV